MTLLLATPLLATLLLASASPAHAADGPTGAVHGWGALGQHGSPDLAGGGLGGAFGLPLAEQLHVDLAAEAGLAGSVDPWLAARPELRLFLAPRLAPAASLSAVVGGGLRWAGSLHPDLAVGAALDLPGSGTLVPRVQARYLVDPTGGGSTVLMTAGLTWRRPQPPPPAPEPVVEAAPPPEPYVWVPHPVSECVLESRVAERFGAEAPGTSPQGGPEPTGDAPTSAVARPLPLDLHALLHPAQGSLVVAALPGDQVKVGEVLLPMGPDWTAVTTIAEGPVDVEIRGAGRVQFLSPAISAGYAVWLRSKTDQGTHVVTFEQGSAELSAADLAWLAQLAANSGSYTYRLRGSYSPEGTAQLNRELAQERAVVVRDALVRAGMPLERIELAPVPESADPDGDPARQRACLITPVPPGGGAP